MKKTGICLMVFLFVMLFSSCTSQSELVEGRVITYNDGTVCADIKFVYPSSKANEFLASDIREITTKEGQTLLDAVIAEYVSIVNSKYTDNNLINPIEIEKTENRNDIALITLKEPKSTMSDAEKILIQDTLEMTVNNIPMIKGAGVYFGQIQTDLEGNPVYMKKGSVYTKEDVYNQSQRIIRLYYPDSEWKGLLTENRTVTLSKNDKLIEVAIRELLTGPKTEGLKNPFVTGVELVSAVVDSGVCFLDFSAPPVVENVTPQSIYLGLLSIVNTASDAESVDKVQIMVGGKIPEEYSKFSVEKYFEKDQTVILENP
ncbi:hypothetical protein SDC9_145450 [bioreactor metagenome]|uniref:GerMN domain-containing protein n=1 Tax=bioreactor metagenome TaxID=1076179 RepID=A0A645E9X2_9ZZZZ